MNLPHKKRGFRKIVVDSIEYDWRCDEIIDIRKHDAPRSKLIVNIDFQDPWLDKFEIRLQRNNSPITPSFIAYTIQQSILLGWQPEGYKISTVKYQNGEFSWEN